MTQDNEQRDLISIVIPVYNTGKYLVNCLQSCIDQTYTNIEIIVVDDHSTDQATLDILKDFEQKDSRFRMIYSAENRGQGYCRNLGVKESQGTYFTFIDSDDYITPDFVERMHQGIVEFNTDFVICDLSKDLNDPSIKDLKRGFKVNTLDSQFNLIHAKDRSIIRTVDLVRLRCLDVFPATCCGKLFNLKRYRDERKILFAEGADARHHEDQDWKANILLNLDTCLVLRFQGYIRVVHMGSVGSPSLYSYSCGIASDFRFYKLVESSPYFNSYAHNLLLSMFDLAKNQCIFTPDFEERQKIIPFLSKYLKQCNPSLTLNPYLYSSLGSIGWYNLFLVMDSQPLGMMYFSLTPQHDALSTDCTYMRELFTGLASQGLKITSFNGSCTPHAEAAKNIAEIKRNFLVSQNKSSKVEANLNKSVLFLFKDNGVTYISARTSTTPQDTFTDVDRMIVLHGIQNMSEINFTKSSSFDKKQEDDDLEVKESIYSNLIRFAEDTQTTYQLRYKYKKRKGNQVHKRSVREVECFMRPQILLVSGGDLLTQQVCRLFKVAGCKIVYFVNNASALTFQTTSGQQLPATAANLNSSTNQTIAADTNTASVNANATVTAAPQSALSQTEAAQANVTCQVSAQDHAQNLAQVLIQGSAQTTSQEQAQASALSQNQTPAPTRFMAETQLHNETQSQVTPLAQTQDQNQSQLQSAKQQSLSKQAQSLTQIQTQSQAQSLAHTQSIAQTLSLTQTRDQEKQAQIAKRLVDPENPKSIVNLSQNIVPADLDALYHALTEMSMANHNLDIAVQLLENAKECVNRLEFEEAEKLAEAKRAQNAQTAETKAAETKDGVHEGEHEDDKHGENKLDLNTIDTNGNQAEANNTASHEDMNDALLEQMFGGDADSDNSSKRAPSPEEIQKLEEKVKERTKEAKAAADKVTALRAKKLPTPNGSTVDPNFLFAPQEFDAVVSFTPELAQSFKDIYGVEAQALGYVITPDVNRIPESAPTDLSTQSVQTTHSAQVAKSAKATSSNQAEQVNQTNQDNQVNQNKQPATESTNKLITFTHPVLENGLAIFIKLMQSYTQRHPEAKFLLVQEPDDTFVKDLGKLHDDKGNNLAKLKLNLSALSVTNSKKFDPITVCTKTKVLLKLGLKEYAPICNIPEALINHIPVLATNHPRYAYLLQDAGKLLDVPATTLRDPSCLPTDEEILPYVDALESLVQDDYTSQCQAALSNLDYHKNVEAWCQLMYKLVGQPFTHDHPGDERKLD